VSLNATNFVPQGPIRSADIKQFVDLFTGVMTDQPVTFKNNLTVGGNQGAATAPLKLYGSVGQTGNLLEMYPSPASANPTWGLGALGQFSWGLGGQAVQDTFLSRIATQNGHSTDTAGLLIVPHLEIYGSVVSQGYYFDVGGGLRARNPTEIEVDNTLYVLGGIGVGNDPQPNMGIYITGAETGAYEYGIRCIPTIGLNATFCASIEAGVNLSSGTATNVPNAWALSAIAPVVGSGRHIDSCIGVEIHNMGGAGIGTAWGLMIDQQTGASNNNIGIECRSQSIFHDNVTIDGVYNDNPQQAPLQVYGIPNAQQWTVGVTSANMNGSSGIYILAGQSINDYALLCRSRDGTHDALRVRGDGWVTLGWSNQVTVGPGTAAAHVNGALLTSVTLEGNTTLAGSFTGAIHDTGVSQSAYEDGNLVLRADNAPRIGFDQVGNSAVCLYKQPGSQSLRVIGGDGADGALVIDTFVQTLTNKTLINPRMQGTQGFAGTPNQRDLQGYVLNQGSGAFALPQPSANWTGVLRIVKAVGGSATVTSNNSTLVTLLQDQTALLYCDGSQWWPIVST
jgi:hypothetical protein